MPAASHRSPTADVPSGTAHVPERIALIPGLACIRRDESTVQLGVEPPHAVELRGAGAAHALVIRAMDGRYDRDGLTALAVRVGLRPAELDALLGLLAEHRLLMRPQPMAPLGRLDVDEAARLAPDLTALALRHLPAEDGGWDTAQAVLARRRSTWVEVHGAGRVGAGAATLLAAAGVGRVSVADPARCLPGDVTPLGLPGAAVGSGRRPAAEERISAVSSSTCRPAPAPRRPDLSIVAPDAGPSASLTARWAGRAEPHLVAYVRETVGVVGPLVVPGRTACLRCIDLHRRDHDPAWPRVAAQLADGMALRACDVALAAAVSALCCLQALAYLDGDPVSAVGATLETSADGARVRRRRWPPHPACGCQWARIAMDPPSATPGDAPPPSGAVRPSGRTPGLTSSTRTDAAGSRTMEG